MPNKKSSPQAVKGAPRQGAPKPVVQQGKQNGQSRKSNGSFVNGQRSVSAAAAYSRGQRTVEPLVKGSYGHTNIKHRELIASVAGSSAFTVAFAFALNPGLASSFPWLSVQAQGWEQYKFNKLKFCYYTRTGTATPGSVLLVPDYDAADTAPASEQIASAYRDVVEEVPWIEEFSCSLDPVAMAEPGNRKYVRTGTLAPNLDIKTYDAGTLFLCTTDGTAVNWGKLWVEYDVDLYVPQLPSGGANLTTSSKVVGSGSVSKAAIFGSNASITGGLTLTAAANTLVFGSPGQYLVSYQVAGTAITGTQPTVSASTATVALLNLDGAFPTATTASGSLLVTASVNQTLVFDFSAVSTTITASTLRVAPYLASLG